MSEAVARYWVRRCSRGEVAQSGSTSWCAALLWMNDELERLRRRVDELRPMAAHGVRNPPEELERLRAIKQRATDVRDGAYKDGEVYDTARYILGEETS